MYFQIIHISVDQVLVVDGTQRANWLLFLLLGPEVTIL